MTPEQLKASILQRAMEGKLVEQDPNDEPASDLLKRIKIEKNRLISEGQIKKDKKESFIFRDIDGKYYEKINNKVVQEIEVPFEIPDSWEWVRTDYISIINPKNTVDDENIEASFIPMTLINDGYSNTYDYEIKSWDKIKKGYTHFQEGDILLAKITPCFQNRKSVIVEKLYNGLGSGTTEVYNIRTIDLINKKYLLYIFKSKFFINEGMANFTGTAGQQRVPRKFIEQFLIPIPPLTEQNRIVEQIEIAFKKVDEYAESFHKLKKLNTEFPEKLKFSLLKFAMMGKLINVQSDNETKEAIYKKIYAYKTELYNLGKIKKTDLKRSNINKINNLEFEVNEKPFDAYFQRDEEWAILPLKDLVINISTNGHQIKQSEIELEGDYPVVSQSKNLVEGYCRNSEKIIDIDNPVIIFGDHTRVIKLIDFPFIVGADGVKILKPIYITAEFLRYHLEISILFVKNRGYARHYSYLKNSLIGVPNINEQNKIVNKLDKIFAIISMLD